MSRFSEIKQDDYTKYIRKDDLNILLDRLTKTYEDCKPLINDYVNNLTDYRVIELSDEIVLTVRRNDDSSTQLAIGYPFPIYTTLADDNYTGVNVRFSIRGSQLRGMQRQLILDKIHMVYSSLCVERKLNTSDFKKAAKEILNTGEKILYIDPNSFIGDSIIELKIVDTMIKNCPLFNDVCIVTSHSKHLSGFYKVCDYNSKQKLKTQVDQSNIVIIPDLVDTHICNTLSFLDEYKPRVPILILSRNIIIYPQETKVEILCMDEEDVLLTHQGIHHYIDDLMRPFIDIQADKEKEIIPCDFTDKDAIFINVFSSLIDKDLDTNFVVDLIGQICLNTSYKILLSTGVKSPYTDSVIHEISTAVQRDGHESRVKYISDVGLSDLQNQLGQYKILAAVTPDTSISHMLTRCGYINFTFYHFGFWDNGSVQSIAGESPIGYCSNNRNQIPIIHFKHISNAEVSRAILTIIHFLVSGRLYIDVPKYGCNYFENRALYDHLLNNINDEELRESIHTIYNFSEFSLDYMSLRHSEELTHNLFEICPLTKIGLLVGNKEK